MMNSSVGHSDMQFCICQKNADQLIDSFTHLTHVTHKPGRINPGTSYLTYDR